MTSFQPLYFVVTVLPLFALGFDRRNVASVSQPVGVERHEEFSSPLGSAVNFRHGIGENNKIEDPKRIFRRDEKTARFDNINALLQHLYNKKEYTGKREVDSKRKADDNRQILKCLQQPSNGITCFGNGKFYQFTGSLEKMTARRISQMVRDSEGENRKETVRKRDSETTNMTEHTAGWHIPAEFRKLWKRRSASSTDEQGYIAAKPYQEVLMESRGREPAKFCYGFVAPNAVHKPKSSAKKLSVLPVKHDKMCPCGGHGGDSGRQSKMKRLSYVKKIHPIWKRSQMVTVACRPLYVPTPKPSVNEGRIAKCRLPCGAHNCMIVPTCPCFPPCRPKIPCPSTCPPDPTECYRTNPPDVPRCPPYEITEEPCPSFACPHKYPFLTTPHCPPSDDCSTSSTSPTCSSSCTYPTHAVVTTTHANPCGAGMAKSEMAGKKIKMMGLWPSFDIKKLLKPAKYQNKEKSELCKVGPVPAV